MKTGRDYVAEGRTHRPPIVVDYALKFQDSRLREGLAYWRSRCRGRTMPARADLDPVDMRAFLANVALLEIGRHPEGGLDVSPRLVGTEIEAIFGPVTGKVLAHVLPPDVVARWVFGCEAAVAAGEPLRFVSRIRHASQDFVATEILLAPLSSDRITVDMLLCVAIFSTDAAAFPEV